MRSGTSYFNLTLLKKQLLRFWPLWAGYALIWCYALPVRCLIQSRESWMDTPAARAARFAADVPELLPILGQFLAVVFGLAAAAAVFSHLYNPRSVGLMHALPIRREGLFLTNYAAGLIGLLAPNLLVWLLTLGAEAPLGAVDARAAAVWLAGQSALCFFYYSAAVFCAQFTGHILALPVFYGVLYWICAAITLLAEGLCREFLYGFAGISSRGSEAMLWLTPVARIAKDVRWIRDAAGLQGAGALALYAAVGLALAALALLVHRVRHVETAGDVVAIPLLRPVFKYGVALCCGLCFGTMLHFLFGAQDQLGLAISLLLWTAIGYLAAEMLLKKSFHVWKSWKGLIAVLAVMAAAVVVVGLDAVGFAGRIPDAGRVNAVTVSAGSTSPYDSGAYLSERRLTDPELTAKVIALHRVMADGRDGGQAAQGADGARMTYITLHLEYELAGAGTMRRQYQAPVWQGTPLAEAAEALLCDPAAAREAYGLDEVDPAKLTGFYVDIRADARGASGREYEASGGRGEARALYSAVCADFQAGTLGRRYLFDEQPERLDGTYCADLHLQWEIDAQDITVWDNGLPTKRARHDIREIVVTLTPEAENTLTALRRMGAIREGELRLYREEAGQ